MMVIGYRLSDGHRLVELAETFFNYKPFKRSPSLPRRWLVAGCWFDVKKFHMIKPRKHLHTTKLRVTIRKTNIEVWKTNVTVLKSSV